MQMALWRGVIPCVAGLIAAAFTHAACGEQNPGASDAVAVEERQVNIMSEGVRLHADIYSPKSAAAGPLPTIIMSHGWGGTAAMLRTQATDFARAGYLVVAFDYRGWGESDSR